MGFFVHFVMHVVLQKELMNLVQAFASEVCFQWELKLELIEKLKDQFVKISSLSVAVNIFYNCQIT